MEAALAAERKKRRKRAELLAQSLARPAAPDALGAPAGTPLYLCRANSAPDTAPATTAPAAASVEEIAPLESTPATPARANWLAQLATVPSTSPAAASGAVIEARVCVIEEPVSAPVLAGAPAQAATPTSPATASARPVAPARAASLRGADAAQRTTSDAAQQAARDDAATPRDDRATAALARDHRAQQHDGRATADKTGARTETAGEAGAGAQADEAAPTGAMTTTTSSASLPAGASEAVTEPGAAEEAFDAELALSDEEAAARLTDEWLAEPIPALDAAPLSLEFSAPSALTLVLPPKPAPPGGSNALQAGAGNAQAMRQAHDAYLELLRAARAHHDAVLAGANAQRRQLADSAQGAFSRVDEALLPQLAALHETLERNRRALDAAALNTELALEMQAAQARRLIGGAAVGARRRIAAAAAGALAQLPPIRTRLRSRFETTYSTGATELTRSGNWAHEQLSSPAKKTAVADAIPAGSNQQENAGVEAKRRAVPRQLDSLASELRTQATAQATATTNRLTSAPPGGVSTAAHIDAFIESLRRSITGGGTGADATQSLAQRGNAAVERAQSQALRSLGQQVQAARDAVRHARQSGARQLATQRGAALTRLSALRRNTLQAMRAQAERALQALAGATRSALPLYGDSTRRVATMLQHTAAAGAAALVKAAQTATAPVQRSLAQGRQAQELRLAQVATGAGDGVARQAEGATIEAGVAAQEFARTMDELTAGLASNMQTSAAQQGESFQTAARGVSSAADSFTQPIPTMYAAQIAAQVAQLDPIHSSEEAAVSAEVARITGAHVNNVNAPLTVMRPSGATVGDALHQAAMAVDRILGTRANSIRNAVDRINMDEDALMAAFRGLTQIQAAALEYIYNWRFETNLRAFLEEEHNSTIGGLNDNEYNSIISALAGDAAAAARFELATTVHWYGNEGERATQIVESLSDEQRRSLTSSREWQALAPSVTGGLHGTELNVFNAVAEGNRARADALRMRDQIDDARKSNDDTALLRAVTELGATAAGADRAALNPDEVVQTEEARRTAIQHEFAALPGVREGAAAGPLTDAQAADALAVYATRTFTTTESMGEGGTVEVTHRLEGTASELVGAIARGGPDSVDARAARILYESERPGGDKPDLAALEGAVVDPRLNPALTPDLTPEQRAAARAEQDQIFARYAELAAAHGVPGAPHNAQEARQQASERLRARYGDSASDRVGADYVASIVLEDRPNPVLAMRHAMLGAGTNEELIHRTLQRLSREDIARLRADYNARYGGDMYAELGVFGRGSFGEVSGDDRLQVERELMGVPRNDRERAEVALFANQQQLNERGALDVNAGSPEERSLLEAQQQLRRSALGQQGRVLLDEFGRPTIVGGSFNERGRFVGPDRDAFGRGLNYSQAAVDAYTARVDRVASFVTTGIAILGAVVGAVLTVATGGLAGPLVAAALLTGLASMGANAALRGGRYGWEEGAVDLGMTAVQAATAGVGAQLGAASQAAVKSAQAAGATAAQITRMGIVSGARIGAITGAMGGVGGAALNERTWERGIGSGLGLVLAGGLRGAFSGAVTGTVTNSIEGIGRGENTLGNAIQGMSASGGLVRGSLNVIGRGVARSGISSIGGMAGRSSELLFDVATGQFRGNRHEAFASIGEAGAQAAFQGFFEGAAEAGGQRIHDQRARRAAAREAAAGEPTHRLPSTTIEPTVTPHPAAEPTAAPRPTAEVQAPPRPLPATEGPEAVTTHPIIPVGDSAAPMPRVRPGETEPATRARPQLEAAGEQPPTPRPISAGETEPQVPARPPAAEGEPAHTAEAMPRLTGGDRDGGGPPRGTPPGGGEGDGPSFRPTEAEIDALLANIEQASAGPLISAPADDLRLRLPADISPARRGPNGEFLDAAGQPITDPATLRALDQQAYWGADKQNMIVQEYRFRAERGLPPLDPAGQPIQGPLGSKMTRMRVHSPDPTAPAGSASREGWTVNIEQGDLRMTADGRWFDTRFGETASGRRIPVDDYRRGATGEWVEQSTGRTVTDPDVHSALNQWDNNMASSHIPLYPTGGRTTPPSGGSPPDTGPPPTPTAPAAPAESAPPPRAQTTDEAAPRPREQATETAPPRPAQAGETPSSTPRPTPDEPAPGSGGTADRAAAGIAGARLAGDAAKTMGLEGASMTRAYAAAERLAAPDGTLAGRVRLGEAPDGAMQITIRGRTPNEPELTARLELVDELPRVKGEMQAARYDPDPNTPNGYVIKISRGTPASEVQRALAHELVEIRAVHGTKGEQPDALGSGGTARSLSPHDRGRLAELDVMARQMAALDPNHPATAATRLRLLDEAQRLVDHLGLRGDSGADDRRRIIARRELPEGSPARGLLDEALRTAADNPFLQQSTGKISEDLALLARRLAHARALLDNDPRALQLREAAILQQAAEAVMRDRLVVTRQGPGEMIMAQSDSAQRARVAALHASLTPEQQTLLNRAIKLAEHLPPLRADDTRRPTPGYEARFLTDSVARPALALPPEQQLRVGQGRMSVAEAVGERQNLLNRQRLLRAEMNEPGTSAARRAELKAEIKSLIAPINRLSEALGTAAGRQFIAHSPELQGGRILELPREGSGVPDLLVEMPPHPGGRLALVECKGGGAELGTRESADGRLRVQQGRREYLESLAQTMADSTNETIKAYGRRLRDQLATEQETRYFLVRQPFDLDDNPTAPEVSEFNIRRP